MRGVVWECHGCRGVREDEWISVAHRKFLIAPESCPMQINLRYCNDRPGCILAVAKQLDEVEARIRAGMLGAGRPPP
jgi:hypothetical protein